MVHSPGPAIERREQRDWLVDPVAETIQIHRLQGEVLLPTRTFGRGETVRSALLAGLELDLNDVFPS